MYGAPCLKPDPAWFGLYPESAVRSTMSLFKVQPFLFVEDTLAWIPIGTRSGEDLILQCVTIRSMKNIDFGYFEVLRRIMSSASALQRSYYASCI